MGNTNFEKFGRVKLIKGMKETDKKKKSEMDLKLNVLYGKNLF